MNGNDSAWTSVKGRYQVKQNPQKIKTATNSHQGALNSNNLLPTPSKTTVPNGNADPAKSVEYASNSHTGPQNAVTNNSHNASNGRGHNNSQMKSSLNNAAKSEAKPQRNGFAASSGDPRKAIDREIKSLAKCEANIKNTRWHFEEELKKSQDRLKRAFNEMRERLNQRERDLASELETCKIEGLNLLNNREQMEQQLKIETARVAAITNPKDLEDLRQKIKKFLNEKRLEDELGKSLRFQYEPDKLIDCIWHFGEVQSIYGRPSDVKRNPSLTSLISAEESSIDSSSVSAGKQEKPVVNQVNIGGLVIKSDCMDPAQLADLTRQLQENLRLQGITEDILPEVTGSSGANNVLHRRPNTQSSRGSGHRNNQTGKNQQQKKQHQTSKVA